MKKIKKKSSVAFFTTVFPASMEYFNDFLFSLENQSNTDFDLIIVNDGVDNLKNYFLKTTLFNIIELPSVGGPIQNRITGIEFVKKSNYNYLIFGDSDDYFERNRVSVSLEMLENYNIVVNDLTLFNKKRIIKEKYLSNRLSNLSLINYDFLLDKNILGLSNTAIKVSVVGDLSFCEKLIAYDWYFFSKLLFKNNRAIFTNETQTFYRQHNANIAGLGFNSTDSIIRAIKVKIAHYECLRNIDDRFDELLLKLKKINIENINLVKEDIDDLFWWENTIKLKT